MNLSLIHPVARLTLAFIWIWQGLVPKLLFRHIDERTMLYQAGIPLHWIPWIGGGEIALGIFFLWTWNRRAVWVGDGLLMVVAAAAVAVNSAEYFKAAFNPMTLNMAALALSIVGWLASRSLPSARQCLRIDPRAQL